jgi:protein SCO1
MRLTFIVGLAVLVLGMVVLALLAGRPGGAAPVPPGGPVPVAAAGPPEMFIPPFALVDQNGKPHTEAILDGQVTIVDFFFTNCPLACPIMTSQLQKLQKRLDGSGVRFLSMSIDPANDTQDVLRSYIDDRFKINTSNWTFLTEPPGQAARLTARTIFSKDLMQFIENNPKDKIKTSLGGEMENLNHSVRFFLVGPDRKVLGMFSSQRSEEIEMLFDHARTAAQKFLKKN